MRNNCIPYVELNTSKGIVKFIIDTGSNLNFINKSHVSCGKERVFDSPKIFTSANGKSSSISNFVNFNPFKINVKNQHAKEFLIFNVNKSFDGLIGYEYLSAANAVIDTAKNLLILPHAVIKMKKKFPTKKKIRLNAEQTKICHFTVDQKEGEFLVAEDKKLVHSVFLHEGLYRVENYSCFALVSNNSKQHISIINPCLSVKVNNFETRDFPSHEDKEILELENLKLDHLNEEEKKILIKTLMRHKNAFHFNNKKLSFTNVIKHRIETTDDAPVYTKNYRLPHNYRDEVRIQIEQMLRDNIIRHSNSAYNSPIWIVPKKPDLNGNRKLRLVIDFRKLNKKTIEDRYPIPNITDILDKLGKCMYFTTLDLASGFHQLEIDERDIHKTAFSTSDGHFEFLRMPFGLKNAPSTFQRVVNGVLSELIGKICLVYVDDIIIFSSSLQEHIENLNKVLDRLRKFNLKIQLNKSEFLKKDVKFLGHIITSEGIKPNPDLIKSIKEWPLPLTIKDLQAFLGTIGYYRRFIQDFAKIVKPLTCQLKKDCKIEHSEDFVKAFEKCKEILMCSSILQYPDFSKPFNLTTDASNYAIGAVLSQGPTGSDKPVAFASRTLNKAETNYSTTEKELLAIIWATKYFRPYLFGRKFTLYTDHKPLTYMFSTKDGNPRLVRWRLSLSEYSFDIQYKAGKQNVVADGLSRQRQPESNFDLRETKKEMNFLTDNLDNESMINHPPDPFSDNESIDTVHSALTDNSGFIPSTENPINKYSNQIILKISNDESNNNEEIFPKIFRRTVIKKSFNCKEILEILKENLDHRKVNCIMCPENLIQTLQDVYRNNFNHYTRLKILISQILLEDIFELERQNEIIEKIHQRAHRGIEENVKQISSSYFFPNMKKKVNAFIKMCKVCKKVKYDRSPYKLEIEKTPIPKKPLDIIHLDIYINSPNIFVSIVDKLSRFAVLIPIKSRAIPDVKKALVKFFAQYGQPKLIVSDNEPSLKSIEIREFLETLEIQTYYTPPNHSEMNGIVERFHSTLTEIFKCLKHKFPNMSPKQVYSMATSEYNKTIHSAHGLKPVEVFFGIKEGEERPMNIDAIFDNSNRVFDHVIKKLENTQNKDVIKHNKNKEEDPNFEENEKIYVKMQGIKNKNKDKFEEAVVIENRKKTVIDDKNKKIHKSKIKRKTN